jgi:hypothetical protein
MVHAEGSEVFYGENEFRLSAINGHMVANLFIRKIYKQHFQWIKKLTLTTPFYLDYDRHLWSSRDMVPLIPPSNWADKEFGYVQTLAHLVWNLKRMERLAKLCFVLPCCHILFNHPFDENENILEELEGLFQEKPEFEIEIVRMVREDNVRSDLNMMENESWEAYEGLESHAWIIRTFKGLVKKCTVKAPYMDRRGRWKVIEGLAEEALLPPAQEGASPDGQPVNMT